MKYRIIEQGLTFGAVLDKLRNDRRGVYGMRLPKWSEDVVVRIQRPDTSLYGPMTAPFLYVDSRFGKVPWKETYIELFSDEWVLVDIIDYDPEEEENKKEFPNKECSDKCRRNCFGECNNKK